MVVRRVQGTSIAWREWVESGEGSDVCLTQFLVSTNAADAPFTSIAAAYAAAVAAGHGPLNPAQVLVCPGTYSGDFTMDTAGIDVIGVAQDSQESQLVGLRGDGQTVFTGTVTVDLAAAATRDATSARWQGIDIKPALGPGVAVAGPNNAALYFYLADCQIVSNDAEAIASANTGLDGFLATIIDVQRCRVATNSAGALAAGITGAGPFPQPGIFAESTSFVGNAGAIGLADAGAFLDSCVVAAGGPGVGVTGGLIQARDTFFQTDEAPAIVEDAASIADVVDCKFRADPGTDFIIGDGLFFHDGITFTIGGAATLPTWDTALTVFTQAAVPQESHNDLVAFVGGGSSEITTQTNVVVTSDAAGGTIVLPPAFSRPGVLRLKLGAGNVGVVTVTAQGGDDIRLGGAAPVVSFPLTDDGVFLVSSPTVPRWEGWAFAGGAAVNCLSLALVSPDPALAPFQSIGAAYAFLRDTVGADPDSPAKVFVCPGIYVEDLTMDTPGIQVVACAMDDYNTLRDVGLGPTRMEGTLTIDLTGFSPSDAVRNCAWRGIDVIAGLGGGGTPAVVFTGIFYQQAFITDCLLSGSALDPGVIGSNTGVGGPGVSRLDLIRVRMLNPDFFSSAGFDWAKGALKLNDCSTSGQETNTVGDGLAPTPTVEAVGCRFANGFTVDDGDLDFVDCSMSSGVTFLAGGGVLELTRCDLPAASILGPGILVYDYQSNLSFSGGLDPALLVSQKESIPAGAGVVQRLDGAHVLTGGETNVIVTTTALGSTVTLPLVAIGAARRHGPIRVKNSGLSTDLVGILVPGGVTLNEGVPFLPLVPGASATFCAVSGGPIGPDWESYD